MTETLRFVTEGILWREESDRFPVSHRTEPIIIPSELSDFKSRFEAAGNAETREELERQAVDVAIDLGNLKAAYLRVSLRYLLFSGVL